MEGARQKVVIAGQGAPAWLTAAAFIRSLGKQGYAVTVVGTGSKPGGQPFGLGDGTLPPVGLDRDPFPDEFRAVAASGAAWSLGIALSGWAAPGVTYFHPFGSLGAEYGPVSFQQLVLKLRKEGVAMRFGDYSLAAMAAQAGRFQRPDGDPRSVLSTCRHGLHADLERLSDLAQMEAGREGAATAAGNLKAVERAEDGSITALCTDAGERIEGDLFIDCSGPEAKLAAHGPGSGWEDWSSWLPCDRVISASVETPEPPLPYSHAQANPGGWVQYLPMQGKTVLNAVFSSKYAGDEDVLRIFQGFTGTAEVSGEVSRPVSFGRHLFPWRGNCIALGTTAAVIDPVGTSNLHLLKTGIGRLLTLLPGAANTRLMAAEYNRQTAAELCHARDFAQLHYRLNGRRGEAFWDEMRKAAVPASLGYKLQMYANLGRVAMYDFEPLDETSWINLFDEQGVQPRQLHPIADGIGVDELKKHAERVRAVMMDALRKMPLHADYLSRVNAAYSKN